MMRIKKKYILLNPLNHKKTFFENFAAYSVKNDVSNSNDLFFIK